MEVKERKKKRLNINCMKTECTAVRKRNPTCKLHIGGTEIKHVQQLNIWEAY